MKIDKYFIDKLLYTDPKTITSDIISISLKLGHSTVAKGVEHEIQLQYLKDTAAIKYKVSDQQPLVKRRRLSFGKMTNP